MNSCSNLDVDVVIFVCVHDAACVDGALPLDHDGRFPAHLTQRPGQ